ncbi:MAG: 3-isopropylmalate dehydratase [Candidatus Thorarchaeota archaeon]|nr:MAG: 3-isopropylmalate dehydratase [Candidatus Thorarchaeota archaeon]
MKRNLENIVGKVWKFGSNIDTDQIIQGRYLMMLDYSEMAKHTLKIQRPDFASNVQKNDIVVAGKNFGGGSSREEAPKVLEVLGVGCVIAESFARIFFRNSFNVGLPSLIVPDITEQVEDGETLIVNLSKGTVKKDNGTILQAAPLPPLMMDIVSAGGAIPWFKQRLVGQ